MGKTSNSGKRNPPKALLMLALFALFLASFARLGIIAPYRPLDADEESGISEAYDFSLAELVWHGPKPEMMTSPLHYILDKGWIALGADVHRNLSLNVYFRLHVAAWFSLACVFAFMLALSLATATDARVSFAFAAAAWLTFATNPGLAWGTGLQDRPNALWLMLSCLQLWVFHRSFSHRPAGPDPRLTALNALLAATSFASAAQAITTAALRAWPSFREGNRSLAAKISLEALPATMIASYYCARSYPQIAPIADGKKFLELWLAALEGGFWAPPRALFGLGFVHFGDEWSGSVLVLILGALLALLPLFSKRADIRRLHALCGLMLVAGAPITLASWKWANTIGARYFYFLYPFLGLAHLLGVLTAAELVARRRRMAAIVVLSWALAQAAFRLPLAIRDSAGALAGDKFGKAYRAEASPDCPEKLMDPRSGPKHSLDSARIHSLCVQGTQPPEQPRPN